MAEPGSEIQRHVLARAAYSSGERQNLGGRFLSELFSDPWDAIDLIQDLEKTYALDLRPFFEDGQPERGWGPWRQKVARDVTVGELAAHIENAVSQRA